MPVPPPSPPKARNEVEQLQFQASQVTDQSLQSTRNMKELCNEAKEMGIRSLVALDDQGEKLDNIENGMLTINKDMKEAEENMRGMENCCSFISFPCAKGSKDSKFGKLNDDAGGGGGGDNPRPGGASDAGIPTYGGFISKYGDGDAREKEMEDNMEEVSNMVGNLRNMAIDMGSEIGNQNAQIDRINAMAEDNVGRIGTANEKAHKLLK